MKKQLLLITSVILLGMVSFATIHTVIVSDHSFSPANFTAHPGDTIRWEWLNGIHTTKSSSIPPNAAPWTSNISSASTSFSYVVGVPGAYAYNGTHQMGTGMTGNFTVATPATVTNMYQTNAFAMFPNPASGPVRLWFRDTDPGLPVSITLVNMNGMVVVKKMCNGVNETELNVNDIPNGQYYITAQQGNLAYREQLVVAH